MDRYIKPGLNTEHNIKIFIYTYTRYLYCFIITIFKLYMIKLKCWECTFSFDDTCKFLKGRGQRFHVFPSPPGSGTFCACPQ